MPRERGSDDGWDEPAGESGVAWDLDARGGGRAAGERSDEERGEGGRFEERDALGAGAGGRVVRGLDRRLERDVALKVVAPGDALALARLRREAAILVALEHPGIVPLYDLVEREDGGLQLALRIVRGRSLERALADDAVGEGPSRGTMTAHLRHLARAAEAVAWAHHRGFVHRDLKPANIMVGEFGETQVIDWGLAAHVGERATPAPSSGGGSSDVAAFEPGLTHAGAVLGTPCYMSPEQARGKSVDARADVWSLGCILFEIAAGRRAFTGDDAQRVLSLVRAGAVPSLREAAPRVSPELAAIAARALEVDPERRYADARELADDLNAWLDGRPVAAHRYAWSARLRRFARRRRVPLALAAGVVAAAAAYLAAPRPPPERITDTALTETLSQGLARNERNLATALAREAEQLLSQGNLPEAAADAARSLALAPRPEARGVLALTEGAQATRLTEATALTTPACAARALHPDGARWLCRRAEAIALMRGAETLWRAPVRAAGMAFVAGGERVAIMDGSRGVTLLASDSGAVVREREALPCAVALIEGGDRTAAAALGHSCLAVVDGDGIWWARQGSLQAGAVGANGRWAALDSDGTLADGVVDRSRPASDDAAAQALPATARPSGLGETTVDVSAMALGDEAVYLGTLRGEIVALGLDGHTRARATVRREVPVTGLTLSSSGRTLGVTLDRGGPTLLASDSLQRVATLPEADDGALMLVGDEGAVTVATRLARWELGARRLGPLRGLTGLLTIALDDEQLAAAYDVELALFGADGELRAQVSASHKIKSLALHPWLPELVASRVDGTTLERYDDRLAPLGSVLGTTVRRLAYTASGTLVALPYRPELWLAPRDAPTERVVLPWRETVDMAIQGERVALLARTGEAYLLDVAVAPVELARCEVPGALALSLTPDASAFVVARGDGVALVATSGCHELDWRALDDGQRPLRATDVQASTDGAWVAATTREGRVLIWDAAGRLVANVRAHAQRGTQIVFTPSSDRLFSLGWDGAVQVFDLATLTLPDAELARLPTRRWGVPVGAPSRRD